MLRRRNRRSHSPYCNCSNRSLNCSNRCCNIRRVANPNRAHIRIHRSCSMCGHSRNHILAKPRHYSYRRTTSLRRPRYSMPSSKIVESSLLSLKIHRCEVFSFDMRNQFKHSTFQCQDGNFSLETFNANTHFALSVSSRCLSTTDRLGIGGRGCKG